MTNHSKREEIGNMPQLPTGVVFIDPSVSVLTEIGHALDALGMLDGVKLRREPAEADDAYRARLISKLRAGNTG